MLTITDNPDPLEAENNFMSSLPGLLLTMAQPCLPSRWGYSEQKRKGDSIVGHLIDLNPMHPDRSSCVTLSDRLVEIHT